MALKKSEVKLPDLPKETINVASLGGEVVVRGMLLRERFTLLAESSTGVKHDHIAKVLAACVVDADGVQLLTAEEWEQFGGVNFDAVLELFQVVRRVSGLDSEQVAKN